MGAFTDYGGSPIAGTTKKEKVMLTEEEMSAIHEDFMEQMRVNSKAMDMISALADKMKGMDETKAAKAIEITIKKIASILKSAKGIGARTQNDLMRSYGTQLGNVYVEITGKQLRF